MKLYFKLRHAENRRVVVHGVQEQMSAKTSIIHWFYKDPLCDESNEVQTQKKGEKEKKRKEKGETT